MDTKTATSSSLESNPNQRVTLNVGGKLFETTISTLQSAGPSSLLSSLSCTQPPTFIDRDPHIFSSLLSLLRTHRLPSTALRHFSFQQLLNESQFYGLHSSPLLLSSLFPPPFSPFDASFVTTLSPPSSPIVSTFSAPSTSSPLLLAHFGQISNYDPTTLTLSSTLRTHLDDISSIASISPEISAVGSNSSSGLHFYSTATHVGSLYWVDNSDTRTHKSRVTSIADSVETTLFSAAFECKHGENAVHIVDKSTLKVVTEIGRQSGSSAKSSAVKRLRWVPKVGLLVGSSVSCGAFGYSGYVRVWDPRSGEMVWETNEPGGVVRTSRLGDTMADIDVDPEGLFLAKVGSKSGDLGVADLRKLGSDPWVYMEEPNPGLSGNWKAGGSVVVHCFNGNVLVGRDGELEAWSRVEDREIVEEGGGVKRYRRNYVDKLEDSERGIIRKIEGGGNRVFLIRENLEGVDVWETCRLSEVKLVY